MEPILIFSNMGGPPAWVVPSGNTRMVPGKEAILLRTVCAAERQV